MKVKLEIGEGGGKLPRFAFSVWHEAEFWSDLVAAWRARDDWRDPYEWSWRLWFAEVIFVWFTDRGDPPQRWTLILGPLGMAFEREVRGC